MPLPPGSRLGPYEVTAPLGAGGMGEVYRAHDPRLGRDVAVKVLRGETHDRERLRRFEQEARAAGALSHPGILAVYDVGSHEGAAYVVSELLEGHTLRALLEAGPLPARKAVDHALQIAHGLAAAHRRGIVHRDLKPENVYVTADGRVKILDFGLAKLHRPLVAPAGGGGDTASWETDPGRVMGTAAYMSPEQVRGLAVDHRTDLFSLGAVLFEMLSGRPAFRRDSAVETMNAVLHEDPPDLAETGPAIPAAFQCILQRCLEKRPEDRFHSAHDLALALEAVASGVALRSPPIVARRRPSETRDVPGSSRVQERAVWAAVLVAVALTALLAGRDLGRESTPDPVVRFDLELPDDIPPLQSDLAVSPDGTRVALAAWDVGSLWLRSLDAPDARIVPGTRGAAGPFWSPDGAALGFFVPGHDGVVLRSIALPGGEARTICTVPATAWMGGTWNDEGRILFSARDRSGRFRVHSVPASGGEAIVLLELDEAGGERGHFSPQFLLDGHRFLFGVHSSNEHVRGTWLSTIDPPHARKLVLPGVTAFRHSPPDRLLFVRDGALLAQRFDPDRARLEGEPTTVVPSVATPLAWTLGNSAQFSVSESGVLVYAEREQVVRELTWLDRRGGRIGTVGEPGLYRQIQLSPDERLVAAEIDDGEGGSDLWELPLDRGVADRLTSGPASDTAVVWTADSHELFFSSNRGGDGIWRLHRTRLDSSGAKRLPLAIPGSAWAESATADGRLLVLLAGGPRSDDGVWALSLDGAAEPELLMKADGSFDDPQVSPDGRWLAYCTAETGEWEVYVAPFRRAGERQRISPAGGRQPRWRADGQELFYVTPPGQLMSVRLRETGGRLEAGLPTELFDAGIQFRNAYDRYSPSRDGQRFLVITPVEKSGGSFNVVLNWPSLLE